jgi:hypothetical protein
MATPSYDVTNDRRFFGLTDDDYHLIDGKQVISLAAPSASA